MDWKGKAILLGQKERLWNAIPFQASPLFFFLYYGCQSCQPSTQRAPSQLVLQVVSQQLTWSCGPKRRPTLSSWRLLLIWPPLSECGSQVRKLRFITSLCSVWSVPLEDWFACCLCKSGSQQTTFDSASTAVWCILYRPGCLRQWQLDAISH